MGLNLYQLHIPSLHLSRHLSPILPRLALPRLALPSCYTNPNCLDKHKSCYSWFPQPTRMHRHSLLSILHPPWVTSNPDIVHCTLQSIYSNQPFQHQYLDISLCIDSRSQDMSLDIYKHLQPHKILCKIYLPCL